MTTIDRVNQLSTRSERQGRWLKRLRASAEDIRLEFAQAIRLNDPNKIERLTEAYVNKCKFIAHVELTVLQQEIDKNRLIRTSAITTY